MDPILEPLNEVQREIVTSCDGPMLVLAGAGSGKTRAVTHKISWLLSRLGYMPWRVLAMTFTNKAAGEMRDRVKKLVGIPAEGLEMGTFHSMCARMLRRHADRLGYTSRFLIFDADDSAVLMRQVVDELGLDRKRFAPRALCGAYDTLRSHNRPVDKWVAGSRHEGDWRQRAAQAFLRYEQHKRRLDAMDFTDLMERMLQLLCEHDDVRDLYRERYQYVLVDEMQDTNEVQLRLLEQLVGAHQRICAVGDDDQSIYGWRGARVENMLDFEKSFPGARILRMEQNYRSTRTIIEAAHEVIANNRRRHVKKLWTENGDGDGLVLVTADSEGDEARRISLQVRKEQERGTALRKMAVFFRTNAQSRSFEEELARQGLPHVVVGGMRFYERAEVKDTLAYLRLVVNERDDVSFVRVANKPARGIGDNAIEKLRQAAATLDRPLLATARELAEGQEPERWVKALAGFVRLIDRWKELAPKLSVAALAQEVLKSSGYVEKLSALDRIEAESRLGNLDQLITAMTEFQRIHESGTLIDYLEQVALITDIDLWQEEQDRLPLMTVHAAKGLEFDVVFASGMEEGLFPYESHVSQSEVEEERRLFYVALTRARQRVVVSWARSRARFGEWSFSKISRFVGEIPDSLIEREDAPARRSFAAVMGGKRPPAPDPARARPRRARPAAPPPPSFAEASEGRRGAAAGPAASKAAASQGSGERPPAPDPARARPRRSRPAAPPPPSFAEASEGRRGAAAGPTASEAAASPGQSRAESRDGGDAPKARRGHRTGTASPGPSWTGKQVRHRTHGPGRVLAVIGSGEKALVVVRFEESSVVTTVPAGSLQLLP
ncbi:MAG: ATP-dependent DNA helicase PcrA [Deltaproteobacteria bacterium]|nr:ATP-dependent DNA helicase PcrA [Deltaproteobacteria bacterium]